MAADGLRRARRLLHRLADLIVANADALALADTTDMGKPISDSRGRTCRARRLTSASSPTTPGSPRPRATVRHRAPHVHPVRAGRRGGRDRAVELPADARDVEGRATAAWGNTVILKPAEDTPRPPRSWRSWLWKPACRWACSTSCTVMAPKRPGQFADRVSPKSIGLPSPASPPPDARSHAPPSANLIPVSLELGGKGANLVFADADLDDAVAWSIRADLQQRRAGLPGRQPADRSQRGIYADFRGPVRRPPPRHW